MPSLERALERQPSFSHTAPSWLENGWQLALVQRTQLRHQVIHSQAITRPLGLSRCCCWLLVAASCGANDALLHGTNTALSSTTGSRALLTVLSHGLDAPAELCACVPQLPSCDCTVFGHKAGSKAQLAVLSHDLDAAFMETAQRYKYT